MVTPAVLAALVVMSFIGLGQVAVQAQQHRQTQRSIGVVLTRYADGDPNADHRGDAGWEVWGAWLAPTAERLLTQDARERLRHQLDVAGRPEVSALTETLRNKVLYALVFGGVSTLFAWSVGGWSWIVIPFAILAGFWLPDLLIYNSALRRTEEIAHDLPDTIELLNLCIEAGMSFQSGLSHVAKTQKGAAAEEFARVLREMQLGQSRHEALIALSARTRQEDLLHLIHAMVQADSLGIAMSGVLAEQAAEMRGKRSDRAREAAQKVPVKILLPVIVCFLPGIFIIVLGPAVISLTNLFSQLP